MLEKKERFKGVSEGRTIQSQIADDERHKFYKALGGKKKFEKRRNLADQIDQSLSEFDSAIRGEEEERSEAKILFCLCNVPNIWSKIKQLGSEIKAAEFKKLLTHLIGMGWERKIDEGFLLGCETILDEPLQNQKK